MDGHHDQGMDYTNTYYPLQTSQHNTQQQLCSQPNVTMFNGEMMQGPQTFQPSTSTMFYQPPLQPVNGFMNDGGGGMVYGDSLAPPSTQYGGHQYLSSQNSAAIQNSLSPNVAGYSASPFAATVGMTPSPAASCESSLYSGGGRTSSPRMPMGMSAQSPGVYSPLSDAASPSSLSQPYHVSASRTTSCNSMAPMSVASRTNSNHTGSIETTTDGGMSMDSNGSALLSDPVFIQRHNFSVELYQNFKENVDLLFAANTPIQEKNRLIPNILEIVNLSLISAMEAEKDYLMNEVLCPWAVRQQKYSIAALWTQQIHYHQLNAIDKQFEYFGELLEQTLCGLQYMAEHFPKLGFEEAFGRVRHIAHLFLFYSVVVARQPPAVVVKCGEAENHRRSRFWFNTELRILGGRAFGLHQSAENLQVKCYLITDETAKKLRGNAYYDINENEHFVIEPNMASFQTFANDATGTGATEAFAAKFDDMRVSKKEQLRREEVWKKRYNLCYNIRIPTSAKYNIELVGKKVSLPFAILVGPKCDVEAKLFLERSFADFAILETPQKSTDQPAALMPRPFLAQSRQHLANRLKPDSEGRVLLENFLKMPVAEEYCVKTGVGSRSSNAQMMASAGGASAANDSGEWKLVPFFEWFFKLAELVNKNFVQLWNDGLIFGFCGKEDAEQLLAECQCPTLLIRFSDYEFAKIKISVRDRSGAIRHHWYETQDLVGRSLNEELLHNIKYRDVEFIYPNTSLEETLGARRNSNAASAERARKPRNLQPSPIYFNNQEPAVRLNSF